MTYEIRFTDSINTSPLVVNDMTVNDSTSLSFPGRNVTGYGQMVGENLLHLLENFANTEPPPVPVKGQLWYDSNIGVTQLKIYDGTSWVAAGGLKKGATEPDSGISTVGDLWVNTNTQQLFLFSGSGWILVGPKFSSGAKTGAEPETIIDTLNNTHTIVSQYVAGERVAIISKTTFTPKEAIPGFTIVQPGVNLNATYNKYYGVAEKASALLVGSATVSATNFLRSDVANNTYYPINVRTVSGITVGDDAQFAMRLSGAAAVLSHNTPSSNIDIQVNSNGSLKTVIRVDSSLRVGINNNNPQESLDVTGNIVNSGTIRTINTSRSTSTTTGALIVAGGAGIVGDVNIGGSASVYGNLNVAANILPTSTGVTIGSASNPFGRLFSSRIDGNLYGTVVGTLTGDASGSAAKLASPTTFSLNGDITSNSIEFDGSTGGTNKTFVTQLNDSFITAKPAITSIAASDEFIVSRGTQGLKKITKEKLWESIPKTPAGVFMPYAGATAPAGWLLCDGSEVLISQYPALFSVVGYTYGDQTLLEGAGTFRLPDMRGRNPLGLDNMNNSITVPSKTNTSVQIQSGGGSANRVTSVEADNLGLGSGSERATAVAATTNGVAGTGQSAQALNVMNPYLSVNYIIYTGA